MDLEGGVVEGEDLVEEGEREGLNVVVMYIEL